MGLYGFFAWRALVSSPLLTLISDFAPFLFLPLPLVLLTGVATKSRTALLCGLVVSGLFIALFGHLFIPKSHTATASSQNPVTMMTFNLGPDQSNPNAVVAAIETENADVVAVQELVPATATRLKERLGQQYPFTVLDIRRSTTGLLSRYPIQKIEWFQPGEDGRWTLEASVNVRGNLVQVFAVHSTRPRIVWYRNYRVPTGIDDREQETEILDILDRTSEQTSPVVVMGDFNMTEQSSSYGRMSNALRDAFAEAGWGFGFTFPANQSLGKTPVPGPLVRLDYIFHSADLVAETARVTCHDGSDHCYLVAQLSVHTGQR